MILNYLRYVPFVPIFPLIFVNPEAQQTYTLMLPLPTDETVSVPFVTVFWSPVTASIYVPFGRFLNVAPPEIATQARLSVLSSVPLSAL